MISSFIPSVFPDSNAEPPNAGAQWVERLPSGQIGRDVRKRSDVTGNQYAPDSQ
jgi:hypothetical protein